MNVQGKHFYVFGRFRFDPEERLLVHDGEPVPLAPKVAETLLLLVQNVGHLLEKESLLKRIWPDAFVEEGNLNKNIFVLRRVLSERDSGREYIETVPKRGYRFVATVNQVVDAESSPLPQVTGANLNGKRVSRAESAGPAAAVARNTDEERRNHADMEAEPGYRTGRECSRASLHTWRRVNTSPAAEGSGNCPNHQ